MGQYQTRTVGKTDDSDAVITPSGDAAPPVFGSVQIETLASTHSRESSLSAGKDIDSPPRSSTPGSGDVEAARRSKSPEKLKKIPIVFHWDHGGEEVYVAGSFSTWDKIPMNRSREKFATIVELPEGRHEYKFFVDNQWVHDPGEECQDNGLGSLNNIVTVTKMDFEVFYEKMNFASLQARDSPSPVGSYTQDIPPRSATTGLPPHLPPLLQHTILNQEPPSQEHPTLLSEPNHVILGHLYALSIKDGVLVMGATNRYKEKYITTLMYKPV